jgi:hypothetical protein
MDGESSMRKLAAIGLAVVALCAAQPAWAESWRVAGFGGDAPQRAIYVVDTDSIVRDGDTVRFRTSTVWEGFVEGRDFNKSVTQRQGSCSTKSSKIIVNNLYANGQLTDVDDAPGDMITHAADSLMRGVLDIVCGDAAYETDAITDYEATLRAYFAETANG